MDLILTIIGPVLWLAGVALLAIPTLLVLWILLLRYWWGPLPLPRPGEMDE